MKAALIEFELDSSTQNVGSFYAGFEDTLQYFTREAVCSALSYADRIWQDKTEAYGQLSFRFESTPAEPVEVHVAEVVYKAGDIADQGLLRFGRQVLLLPGSRFRCAVWGDLPSLAKGQVFLIGKKRAPARITDLIVEDVAPGYADEGPTLPIQVSPGVLRQFRTFAPLVGTQRYLILKVPLAADMRRFKVGNYVIPWPENGDEM
jgi:hypothetical protein